MARVIRVSSCGAQPAERGVTLTACRHRPEVRARFTRAVLMAGALMGPAGVMAPHAGAAAIRFVGAEGGRRSGDEGSKESTGSATSPVWLRWPRGTRSGAARSHRDAAGQTSAVGWRASQRVGAPSRAVRSRCPATGCPSTSWWWCTGARVHGRETKGTFRAVAASARCDQGRPGQPGHNGADRRVPLDAREAGLQRPGAAQGARPDVAHGPAAPVSDAGIR